MPQAGEVVGKIPAFTTDDSSDQNDQDDQDNQDVADQATTEASESDAQSTDAVDQTGTDTQAGPPAAETAASDQTDTGVDTSTLKEQTLQEIAGLEETKRELIHELADLRGQRRDAKQQQIDKVQEQIDDKLDDVNPDDVALIDRVLKAKGYVARQDVSKMFYDARKQEIFSRFLKEFPEYNEVNDPDRRKFGPLLRELQLYKEPGDPELYADLLRRAHNGLTGTRGAGGRSPAVQKRQVELAGVGSGGAQRSSSVQPFSPEKRMMLLQGGWSDEDIKSMEERASQE